MSSALSRQQGGLLFAWPGARTGSGTFGTVLQGTYYGAQVATRRQVEEGGPFRIKIPGSFNLSCAKAKPVGTADSYYVLQNLLLLVEIRQPVAGVLQFNIGGHSEGGKIL